MTAKSDEQQPHTDTGEGSPDTQPYRAVRFNLLGGWVQDGQRHTASIIYALQKFYGIRLIAIIDPQVAIVVSKDGDGRWFTLADNGGEINVEPINIPDELVSVPTTSTRIGLTPMTIAYRVWRVMHQQPIDYDVVMDDTELFGRAAEPFVGEVGL